MSFHQSFVRILTVWWIIRQIFLLLHVRMFSKARVQLITMLLCSGFRKSSSWHTALRLRKKSEKKDKDSKREGKLENGYRKSRDGLANKVSVKVTFLPRVVFLVVLSLYSTTSISL